MKPKKRIFSCLHTHTTFCDGKAGVEDNCRVAWEKGLQSLGFSTHAPITKKTGFYDPCWKDKEQRLDKYIEEVNAAKRRWEGKLPVYLGLEVDYVPGLMGPADKDYHNLGLDYIIGSVHFMVPEKGAPFTVDHRADILEKGLRESYGGDIYALTNAYYEMLKAMMRAGGFNILGHPDLVRKNNLQNKYFNEDTPQYRKQCESVVQTAADAGVVIEINTGPVNRGYLDTPYPSLQFLKMFNDKNIPMMINADSHTPEHLDGFYEEAKVIAQAAGYVEMVRFSKCKDGCPVWKKVRLV